MNSTIAVEGIECYAYHGCLPEERKIGAKYRVDVYITGDVSKAVQSDNLNDTYDYVKVYKLVAEEMERPSNLIEHAGGRILEALKKSFSGTELIEVKITKYNPPVNGYVASTSFTIRSV